MANKKQVLLIDYHLGNVQSVANALNYLNYDFVISNSVEDIIMSDAYILPGVGAFGEAMSNLNSLNIIKPLEKQVLVNKKPIIGFCLGMQILAESSDESPAVKGLGWIKGKVLKFNSKKLTVPHVGWNSIKINNKKPLFTKVDNDSNYYFDHSFYLSCNSDSILATCNYGGGFPAAVGNKNIFGVQFHPEKSQFNGLKLLRGFFDNYDIQHA